MLEAVIQDLIRQQRPYYIPQGSSVKGIGDQYWLVFQHRDAEKGGSFLKILLHCWASKINLRLISCFVLTP